MKAPTLPDASAASIALVSFGAVVPVGRTLFVQVAVGATASLYFPPVMSS